MTEIVSNYENEKNNIQSINSKILGISFLSTVNLFVINYLESNKKLFVETVMVYSVSILLLLIALYQSINQTIKLFDSYNLTCIQINNLINPIILKINSKLFDSETEIEDIKNFM